MFHVRRNTMKPIIILTILISALSSCDTVTISNDRFLSFNEEDKIFHAAPQSNGIGGMSFGLYKDNRYLLYNSGGIGWSEYSGTYSLRGDTLILQNLDKGLPFVSNRLRIYRYAEQDSTFWEWKYADRYKSLSSDRTLGKWIWKDYKDHNMALGEGNVYQLDNLGNPIDTAYYFIIRYDSLKNYR
jgi:hypothetical protein